MLSEILVWNAWIHSCDSLSVETPGATCMDNVVLNMICRFVPDVHIPSLRSIYLVSDPPSKPWQPQQASRRPKHGNMKVASCFPHALWAYPALPSIVSAHVTRVAPDHLHLVTDVTYSGHAPPFFISKVVLCLSIIQSQWRLTVLCPPSDRRKPNESCPKMSTQHIHR